MVQVHLYRLERLGKLPYAVRNQVSGDLWRGGDAGHVSVSGFECCYLQGCPICEKSFCCTCMIWTYFSVRKLWDPNLFSLPSSMPLGRTCPYWFWAEPRDWFWPMGQEQMLYKQKLKKWFVKWGLRPLMLLLETLQLPRLGKWEIYGQVTPVVPDDIKPTIRHVSEVILDHSASTELSGDHCDQLSWPRAELTSQVINHEKWKSVF